MISRGLQSVRHLCSSTDKHKMPWRVIALTNCNYELSITNYFDANGKELRTEVSHRLLEASQFCKNIWERMRKAQLQFVVTKLRYILPRLFHLRSIKTTVFISDY